MNIRLQRLVHYIYEEIRILIPIAMLVKSLLDRKHPQLNHWQQMPIIQKRSVLIIIGAILGFLKI